MDFPRLPQLRSGSVVPQEVLDLICERVYSDPDHYRMASMDPLKALCLTSKCFQNSAQPYIFRHLKVSLDRYRKPQSEYANALYAPFGYLEDFCKSRYASSVQSLNISCGCMRYFRQFKASHGWKGINERQLVVLIVRLSIVTQQLPSLRALEVGFCPCTSLNGNLTGFAAGSRYSYRPQYLVEVYDEVFLACHAILGYCAIKGWLRNVSRCRVRFSGWHHYQATHLDPWARRPVMSTYAKSISQLLLRVPSVEIVQGPTSADRGKNGTSCYSRDFLKLDNQHKMEPFRQLYIVSRGRADLPRMICFIGSKLVRFHLQGRPYLETIIASELQTLLLDIENTLREIHLEDLMIMKGSWHEVLQTLAEFKCLKQCAIDGLCYAEDDDNPHPVRPGQRQFTKLVLPAQSIMSIRVLWRQTAFWSPLISRCVRDWQALKALVTALSASVVTLRGEDDQFRYWVLSQRPVELEADMHTAVRALIRDATAGTLSWRSRVRTADLMWRLE